MSNKTGITEISGVITLAAALVIGYTKGHINPADIGNFIVQFWVVCVPGIILALRVSYKMYVRPCVKWLKDKLAKKSRREEVRRQYEFERIRKTVAKMCKNGSGPDINPYTVRDPEAEALVEADLIKMAENLELKNDD